MKKAVFIVIMIAGMADAFAQDPQFSQFYSNYLYLAPSFAGLSGKNRITANYRNQWPEIDNGFETYSVSFDMFIDKFSSGFGLLAYQDVAGSGKLRNTSIGIQYAYDFNITKSWHLRPGLHFNYTQRGIDFSKLIWSDQISPDQIYPETGELLPMENIGDIDFATSLIAYSERAWFGTSIDHLLRPNQSLYYYDEEQGNPAKVPVKYTFFGGVKFTMPQQLLRPVPTTIQLAFLYKQQEEFRQLDFGVYWYRNPVVIGVWYRGIPFYKETFNRDAITFLVGLKTGNFNIGYSYDLTISRLITNTGGAHEISVSYLFRIKPIKHKPKAIPCPEF